jgi:hypothetical protein
MLSQGIANPQQLKVLTTALQDYCRVAHIEPGTPAYDNAGHQIMTLYDCGIFPAEELVKALRLVNRIGR